ncbi:MAG: TonB-dependent receptor plug domain-containing protein, partial [Candidatus Symbiothrix sp.]|nr:TonB-dependent receptor plug domain-containing protein [Candidatus Symbiothrix sp.]
MKRTSLFCALLLGAHVCVSAQVSQVTDSSTVQVLNEIVVTAAQIADRAPVTLQTIQSKEISDFLSTKTYPEVLRNIGGVYSTAESGSYGDAKINIRGFKQENFTVMLNGVPLSGFRSGSLFWNNWLGLTDATYRIQLQKGVGGSMLAANSMGGTINILTKPAEQEVGRNLTYNITDYGLNNLRLSLHSGEMKNGWAVSFIGSRTWGDGYVDATPVDSWGYFLNVRKRLNTKHSLLFTLLGSPEKHGQRSQKLSSEETEKYGLKYNKNWGYYNGKTNNVSANFYHKPYLSATHFFSISDKASLSNTLYFSIGNGGGKWTENAGGAKITNTLNAYGQIDWDAVAASNQANGQAFNIQSDYLAGHTWTGLKSAFDYSLSENWKLSSGLHYQYFYSWQNERITDLLGGDYWFEDYEHKSLAGVAGRNPQKTVGDYIRLNNGDRDNHLSLYAQADYISGNIHAFAGALLTTTVYQHWDKYNYVDHFYSDRILAFGGNLKAGTSVQTAENQNIYLNGGIYSRTPYSNVYFANNTNEITKDVRNEQNYIVEAGYKFSTGTTKLTVNAYFNYWKNKA